MLQITQKYSVGEYLLEKYMKNSKTVIEKLTEEQTKNLIEDFLYKLGDRLRIKRSKINLPQSELSKCINISQSELSKIESGQSEAGV